MTTHFYTVDETDDTIKKVRIPKNVVVHSGRLEMLSFYRTDNAGRIIEEVCGYPTKALAIAAAIRGNEIELEDYLQETKSLYERIDRLKQMLKRAKKR